MVASSGRLDHVHEVEPAEHGPLGLDGGAELLDLLVDLADALRVVLDRLDALGCEGAEQDEGGQRRSFLWVIRFLSGFQVQCKEVARLDGDLRMALAEVLGERLAHSATLLGRGHPVAPEQLLLALQREPGHLPAHGQPLEQQLRAPLPAVLGAGRGPGVQPLQLAQGARAQLVPQRDRARRRRQRRSRLAGRGGGSRSPRLRRRLRSRLPTSERRPLGRRRARPRWRPWRT